MEPHRPSVWISHADADVDAAHDLIERMRTANLSVHLREFSSPPGQQILSSLRMQLAASDYLVILISPGIFESKWLTLEARYVLDNDLRQRAVSVIPVKVRPTPIPDFLASWGVIDASKNRE